MPKSPGWYRRQEQNEAKVIQTCPSCGGKSTGGVVCRDCSGKGKVKVVKFKRR